MLVNLGFGCVVFESGGVCMWSENVYEFCFILWYNDLVIDVSGEVIYLCDEESGYYWLFMLLLCCGIGCYVICYGFGYLVFEYVEDGIVLELWVYVVLYVLVKFLVLCLCNIIC